MAMNLKCKIIIQDNYNYLIIVQILFVQNSGITIMNNNMTVKCDFF